MAAEVISILRLNLAELRILLVFVGFFGNFVPGMRNVLARAFDRVAGGQDRGRAAEDDENNEGH